MKMIVVPLIVIASLAPSACAIEFVVGGGFELPIVPAADYLLNVTPNGWTGRGDLTKQGYAGAVHSGDGNQWFDLNPGVDQGTGLSQVIAITAGLPYEFSFLYNGGGGGSTTQIDFSLMTAADTLVSDSVSTADKNVYGGSPWTLYSSSFTPTASGLATLLFFPNGSRSGGFIDAVSLTTVPEPMTASLAGFAALALARQRRRPRTQAK